MKWPKEFMVTPTWHAIPTTWSGFNDVLIVYVDGVQKDSWHADDTNYALSFSGGGRLGLSSEASVPVRWTSFNMWDRVLSPDVIAEHAKSCNGAIGNVKEWYDVWSIVESQSKLYKKPSTCSAPPIRNTLTSANGASASDLQSSGKLFFAAKYKKRKSSIKNVSKRNH